MKLRPRFSVRTLLVLVTLVGLYFGSWQITDRFGVPQITSEYDGFRFAYTPAPCLVYVDSNEVVQSQISTDSSGVAINSRVLVRYWHLWLFGATVRLPYESNWSESSPVPSPRLLRTTTLLKITT